MRSEILQTNSREVSVIIPVYNGALYLAECLSSVADQTWKASEIIVVDDGSTDGSDQVVRKFPDVTYFQTDHLGVAGTRNFGLQKSASEWIAFLDQDDYWRSNSLEVRMQRAKDSDKIIVGRQRWFLDGLEEIPAWVKQEQMNKSLDGYLLGCSLINRKLFHDFGSFDTSFRFCSDFDWLFRLKDNGVIFEHVPEVILHKRIHALNESRHAELSLQELSRALFNSIRRKMAKTKA